MRVERATDHELLRRSVEHRDGDAFAELFRRHIDVVLSYLRRRVATPELALDLAAETFATAVGEAHRFRGDGTVAAWLLGIARRLALQGMRRGQAEDAGRRRLGLTPFRPSARDLREVDDRACDADPVLAEQLDALPIGLRDELVAGFVLEGAR